MIPAVTRYRSFMLAVAVAAALGSAACGDDETTTTTSPSPPTKTDTFTGSLVQSGTTGHPFSVSTTGNVKVTLTAVAPLTTMSLGLRLSTWDGTNCNTTIAENGNARAGTAALSGTANAGNYCVRVYDSGNVPADWTVDYTVEVVHP
jgi:hypothetical protein